MKLAFFETFMTSTFFEGLHSSLWNQPLVSTKTLQESGNKWAKMWNFKLNASLIHVLQDLEESISKHPRRLAKIVSLLTKIREKTNYINKKKNFMAPFYRWGSTASRLQPLRAGSLHFTIQFPEIPGTRFIDLVSILDLLRLMLMIYISSKHTSKILFRSK